LVSWGTDAEGAEGPCKGVGVRTTTEASSVGRGLDSSVIFSLGNTSAHASDFRVSPTAVVMSLLIWVR
jgi:hypothetical protein